jgi:hypothetical protein
MKPVMAWVRSNLTIVILSALILLVLPLAFVGSSYWNAKIKRAREAEANKALNDLKSLATTYTLPSPMPGVTLVTVEHPVPNDTLTRFFREKKQELDKQVAEVVTYAEAANRKKPLVEGVFPQPVSDAKVWELAYLLVGRDGPSAYAQLLKSINAGGPADARALVQSLTELQQQEEAKVLSDAGRDKLNEDELKVLDQKLAGLRLGAYKRRAGEISVYATEDCLPPEVPSNLPDVAPTIEECFGWQWDYWVIADILGAVDAANSRGGQRGTVPTNVVKRIERIDLSKLDLSQPDPNAPASAQSSPATITGRRSGGGNGTYDVRQAELTAIVSSARLPELLDAISRTDLMTVTGLTIDDVDEWAELENGYYYGTDHVVRVHIPIETLWLRSWSVALMPESIKAIVTSVAPAADPGMAAPSAISAAPASPPPPPSGKAKKPPKKGKKSTKRPGETKGGDDIGGLGPP